MALFKTKLFRSFALGFVLGGIGICAAFGFSDGVQAVAATQPFAQVSASSR
jgi:hypothetical protein